ncbi:transglycosylase domain-containing protein [Alkalinema pantanalense CENA528]|uniref:transglycosylase domain-containing protein n=1 Tax=Alkalinema pantanalense TaxID=1620705 RepID=UPI003D6EE664
MTGKQEGQTPRRKGSRRRIKLPAPLQHTLVSARLGIAEQWAWIAQRIPMPLKRRRNQLGLVIVGVAAVGVAVGYNQIERELPDVSTLNTFVRPGTLTIKASDGTVLLQSGPATRERMSIRDLPTRVKEAFIAAEDRRFYQHRGVDYWGIVRATARNVTSGEMVEGGSTITQQLARMVFLNQDRSLIRKIREAMLAQKLERELSKDKLLENYLNLVYLGSEAYGVADAAWVFFSKPVKDLTLAETAMIAGLPPAPSLYSPLVDPKKAQQRRDIVLDRMAEQGFISQSEADAAKAESIRLKPAIPKNLYSSSPYFTSFVQQQLAQYISKEAIEYGGLTVETTLNAKWQKAAETAVKEAIEIDGRAQGFEQAALVAIDPRNGEIRALVGGLDYYKGSQFNRATQAQRQPGSTFKVFVYTAAIAAGFSPYRGYVDERYVVDGYEPKNYGNKYSGSVDMRTALTKSLNVVAVKTLIDVGFEPVIKLAKEMGIKSSLKDTYSLALGAYEVNLLELTSGYGPLAANGEYTAPHAILKVTDNKGKELYKSDFKSRKVLDPGTVAIMTWMLENVVKKGTGSPAALPDRQVAGKTGTSEQARDLWFIGYIPQMVAGVWLGNDDNYPTGGSSGTAAFTWNQFMKVVAKDLSVEKFPDLPKDIDTRKGSIKAKPVEPNSAYSKGIAPDPKDSDRLRDRQENSPPESNSQNNQSSPPEDSPAPPPEDIPPPASYDPPPAYNPPPAADPIDAAPPPAADPPPPTEPDPLPPSNP